MLTKKSNDPPLDPEEILVGKCATCGSILELPRRMAALGKSNTVEATGQEPGVWTDLTFAECPFAVGRKTDGSLRICGAKVIVIPKPRSKVVVQCETTDHDFACRREAHWLIRANVVTPHRCCDSHKRMWESLKLEGFSAVPIQNC